MGKDQGKKCGPVIEKWGRNGKYWIKRRGRESSPWDELDEEAAFSPDGGRWVVRAKLHNRLYFMIDGHKLGPLRSAGMVEIGPGSEVYRSNETYQTWAERFGKELEILLEKAEE